MDEAVVVDSGGEANVQAYMEGLSRLDRVVDDSGYAFTALDVVGKELVSLAPIVNYPHLLFVNVAENQITDVAPLEKLPYLVCVNLSDNALAAPVALPQQSHLQALDVSQNQIPTLQGFQSKSLSSLNINGNTC
uniref:U2A'/phosphoprotein 32 family A C-terminal domain-containing protein n=1 Tax=Globisporangium ultimum (strain ATCC 200006 / CBS 805.95 / DAOM BR144) TaxID=431595 RepID=K3WUA4_GLOUD